MKPSFPAELAAGVAVVRAAADYAEAHGAIVGKKAREQIERVASMVAGAKVDAATLSKANDELEQEHIKLKKERHGVENASMATSLGTSWIGSVIYNLGVLARKERGWQQTGADLVTSSSYAVNRMRDDALEWLEGIRAAALAAPPTAKVLAPPPPPRPVKLDDSMLAQVGEVAFAELRRSGAAVRASARLAGAELDAALQAKGYTPHAPARAFESKWGGVELRDGWIFGAAACAPSGEKGGQPGLIPVVLTDNDNYFFLAADGGAWAQDGIEDPAAVPYADDARRMVARLLLYRAAERLRQRKQVDAAVGARWAKLLGLPRIAQATDKLGRAWGDATALVLESSGRTLAAAGSLKALRVLD